MRLYRWVRPLGVLATLSACSSGCALFNTGGWTAAGLAMTDRQTLLKPISEATPEALRLEYFILERPATDPLLGGELWDELTEMGIMTHETRRALNDQGIRVGIASTSPPQALQKLMGEAREIGESATSAAEKRKAGQIVLLPTGGQTEAQICDGKETFRLKMKSGGDETPQIFENARGIFRVITSSKQEGWAMFEFVPEIHHGTPQMKPVAGDSGWRQFETSQNIQKLFRQRFQLTLNEGESAVVTALGNEPESAGAFFFNTSADGVPMQRLLVVRLLHTGELVSVK